MLRRVEMTSQNLKLPDERKGHELDSAIVFGKKKEEVISKIKY